jgi:uncharacterized GH25 family protein
MKQVILYSPLVIIAILLHVSTGSAHFQGLIPSDDMVTKSDEKTISLDVTFFHPFEDLYMNMAKPAKFGVMVRGRKTDLLETLKEEKKGEFSTWHGDYRRLLNRSTTSYMIISQDRGFLARTTRCTYRMVRGKLVSLT